jgi:hypothetical protein
MQDVLHGAIREPMGSSQIHAGRLAVGLPVGDDNSNDIQSSLHFFRVQVLLIVGGFAGLNFLQDVVKSSLRQGLDLESSIIEFFVLFFLLVLLPALARHATKSCTLVIATSGRGSRE